MRYSVWLLAILLILAVGVIAWEMNRSSKLNNEIDISRQEIEEKNLLLSTIQAEKETAEKELADTLKQAAKDTADADSRIASLESEQLADKRDLAVIKAQKTSLEVQVLELSVDSLPDMTMEDIITDATSLYSGEIWTDVEFEASDGAKDLFQLMVKEISYNRDLILSSNSLISNQGDQLVNQRLIINEWERKAEIDKRVFGALQAHDEALSLENRQLIDINIAQSGQIKLWEKKDRWDWVQKPAFIGSVAGGITLALILWNK